MQVNTGLLGEAGQILTNGSEPAQPRSASNVMGQQGHHPQHIVMSPATSQTGNDPGHSSGASVAKPSKKNSTGRNNVYRAKELAEIKNGLLPFEKAENIRDSREGLRTVSSLSTESSTNSVCSEGFSSMQDASQKLNILGYDEAHALRTVSVGDGTLNNVTDQHQHEDFSNKHQFSNGILAHQSGLTIVGRTPSLEYNKDGYNRVSPSGDLVRRCESPGQGPISAPALPPRSGTNHQDVSMSMVPGVGAYKQYSPATEQAPPLPPPRGAHNPPPTPPRGTTPPPPLPPHNATTVMNGQSLGPAASNSHPMMFKRISPVPGHPGHQQMQMPVRQVCNVASVTRGQSPVTRNTQPMVISNSIEAQQQVAQQMQALSIFSSDNNQVEPPPPYPMGTAALNSAAPPSYSQTIAMRQSPTLSSTSSDYRRSPLLQNSLHYPNVMMVNGSVSLVNPTSPMPSAPSPVNSILSGSSRSSLSSAAWSARQAKTHSPIIMQSVKSTQVQKPVLQQAHGVATSPPRGHSPVDQPPPALVPRTGTPSNAPPPPPPSYADSIQKKSLGPSPSPGPHSHPQSPLPVPIPTTCPPSYTASIHAKQLPPPPPYPNHPKPDQHDNLVSATPIMARGSPVISTAKVVTNNANLVRTIETKQPLQRKYSPHLSETSSNSRSDSPISAASDCPTISASPVQFVPNFMVDTNPQDSGLCFPHENQNAEMAPPPPPPSYKTVINTSPKPERKLYSREQDEMRNESKIKKYPPQAFKFFMEQHVENIIKYYDDRRKRRLQLEQEMVRFGLDENKSEQFRRVLSQKESNYIRLKRAKMDKKHFKKIKTIGIGAFGEVSLVKKIDQNDQLTKVQGAYYAMKTLKKSEVLMRNQVAHVKAERDILAEADNEWIVKLYHSFQDQNNLYFVMDYIPGGDLMSLLIKKGIFEESLAKFYISELVCAVDSVHKMGFIHRDIKPDNILIDSNGHIKLTDFGLCTGFRWTHNSKYYQHNINGHSRQDSMDPGNLDLDSGRCSCPTYTNGQKLLERRKKREHARCIAHSLVGTPNYIAPEVLERKGYSQLCDWWSVGVILYEMLVGQPPFLASGPAETQMKVIRWHESLHIPSSAGLSNESRALILSLCTSDQQRLGKNGSDEIKNHTFFRGIDFSVSLRSKEAPYKPEIKHLEDTSNFDPIDPDKLRPDEEMFNDEDNNRDYHGFYEFTFRRFFDDAGHPVFSPGPNALRSMAMRQAEMDNNENPSGPVYV